MKAIGIILAGGNNSRMQELSNKRAIAAMPIGGSYRSIDFALSNMSNSHVQTVAVLTCPTKHASRSSDNNQINKNIKFSVTNARFLPNYNTNNVQSTS